jgi:hypothetical protein
MLHYIFNSDLRPLFFVSTRKEAVDFTFDFKLKYDPRREDHKSVSDADISSLYSALHKVKPKAVLFIGFSTSK